MAVDLPLAGAVVLLYRLCAYWFLVASVYCATSVTDLAARTER